MGPSVADFRSGSIAAGDICEVITPSPS